MIKPAYDIMRSNAGQSICFVPHRGQCYTTLTDLLTHSATDMDKFVAMDEYTLSQYTDRISDPKIAEGLSHGFAVLSEGAHPTDQAIAKHLFQTGAVRVLIVPREACHSLDLTAPLVIVMSTQYAMFQPATGERTILDYPMSDILQMQTMACGTEQSQTGQFSIFTQPDNASLISRFMNDGLPLESTLIGSDLFLHTVLGRMLAGAITTRQDLLDLLATTFAGHRADVNPAYYSCEGISHQDRLSYLVDDLVETWRRALLVRTKEGAGVRITAFGSAVVTSRISMAQVNKLFALSESRALKIASSTKTPEVSQDLLETSLNRLSKTLQKRIRPEQADEHLPVHKALLIPLLAKKLAPEGSDVEQVQADLAVKILQALAQADADQADSRRSK
jgi:antiviral helicase SLH1